VYRRPAVLESTRTIDIDEFVQREEIDPRYIICSYYLVPMARLA
jgi:DNA end-binding protein Ku